MPSSVYANPVAIHHGKKPLKHLGHVSPLFKIGMYFQSRLDTMG